MSSLSEKHRIIYLTYKAYQTRGKKIATQTVTKITATSRFDTGID